MKTIAILGSTGSIGCQALDVVSAHPDKVRVIALAAGRNITRLAEQIAAHQPSVVGVASVDGREQLIELLKQTGTPCPEIHVGESALNDIAALPEVDSVVVGLVGFLGLIPTLHALKSGKQVLTANKETLVTAGHLITPYLSQIVPLDSEHSALFQCLNGEPRNAVKTLFLTASGGPFRTFPIEDLPKVTRDQALRHPNWVMGEKVTIDSATMMNKGLELIEAMTLFQVKPEQIQVVIHPQSIIHSAVGFMDGSVIAQMGQPDMRVPIQYGLSYPERWSACEASQHLDLTQLAALDFEAPDLYRFPCLKLAQDAARWGGSMPVVLNAADEMAVEAFLDGRIGFMDIPRLIETLLEGHTDEHADAPSLAEIIEIDSLTREQFNALALAPTI